MKKVLITLLLVMTLALTMAIAISAAEITVVDDGATEITLGDCVIEGLDGVTIPSPTRGFTYVLNTDTKTAKISKWADYNDKEKGATFCTPSTVTYDGMTYTVTNFDNVVQYTDNGNGLTNQGNFYLVNVYIADTIVAIPNDAFRQCRALEYVYVGSGVETIGQLSFACGGFTAGAYYVDYEYEEEGAIKTKKEVLEKTGSTMGNIKAFVWKTTKITALPKQCFHHMEFDQNAVIEFAIENVTVFGEECLSYNHNSFQDGHYFTGKQLTFGDTFDIRNATSIHASAFSNNMLATTYILNANQTDLLNVVTLRGNGANAPNGHNGVFVIYGGETPETAVEMTGKIWTSSLWYWSANVHYHAVFKGYIKANSTSYDGNENQNGYGKDMIDYYFESDEALKYYLDSVALSSAASNTYTRYAKNTYGYFNVCDGNGSSTPYNLTYADGQYTLSVAADKYVMSTPKYTNLVDGYCTASTLCYVCDCQISEGIKHEYNTTVVYADFTNCGVKTTGCTHDYCALYANPVVVELEAIFSDFKYSVREDQTTFGLVMAYKVNNIALAEYEAINGSLSFGVMAVSKKNITAIDGENEIISNPLNNEGTTSLNNVVVADVSNNKLANVNLIIIGSGEAWDEAKTVDFYVLGYVINGEELQYFQNSSNASVGALTTINYENAKEVA